jgi:hypothetical protein
VEVMMKGWKSGVKRERMRGDDIPIQISRKFYVFFLIISDILSIISVLFGLSAWFLIRKEEKILVIASTI